MKHRPLLLALASIPVFFTGTAVAEEFSIEFDWDPAMKKCFSRTSPSIKLLNVPPDTTELRVNMKDRDAPTFRHGGGKLEYAGEDEIPAGALESWKGPCPPYGSHTYEFAVEARAGKKKVGKAKYSRKFP